jgi:hypothetical protein
MSGKIGKQIPNLPATTATSGSGASSGSAGSSGPSVRPDEGPLMLVPAGFVSNILSGLSKSVMEITGGYFGRTPLAQRLATTAPTGFPAKLVPFQIIEPSLAPQSAGPNGGGQQVSDEALVVVPAGFLGGILGGILGGVGGGVVGKWLGSESTGKVIGSTIGKIGGGFLPFSVVPPSAVSPEDNPGAADEPMVLVPAGFFGNLLSSVSGTVGGLIGGKTGRQVGESAAPLLRLIPFQEVPQDLAPQSAGPDTPDEDRLIVLPAGFFGNLLSGLAGTIGSAVGGAFGHAKTGQAIGEAARPIINMIPFHAAPPELQPQSADPASGAAGTEDQMMLVPAGLFGSLLSGLAGTLGGLAGQAFGQPQLGRTIGEGLAPIAKLIPFQTVEPQPAPTA